MAKFYVGQKVRVVRGWDVPSPSSSPIGKEAMIVEGPSIFIGRIGLRYRWRAYVIDHQKLILGNDCDFEPLQKDDGRQIITWKECPWMPEHLREMA